MRAKILLVHRDPSIVSLAIRRHLVTIAKHQYVPSSRLLCDMASRTCIVYSDEREENADLLLSVSSRAAVVKARDLLFLDTHMQ